MGFWDGVKAVGKFLSDTVKKHNQNIQELKAQYSLYDDDYLIRKYKNSTNIDIRLACAAILNERGYTSSDLQN